MANPMKTCSSCKGTGKIVDNAKKMHIDSGKERPSKKDSSGSYPGGKTDDIKGKGKK